MIKHVYTYIQGPSSAYCLHADGQNFAVANTFGKEVLTLYVLVTAGFVTKAPYTCGCYIPEALYIYLR